MSYIKRFLGKDTAKDRICLDNIEALIKAGVEENINLDDKEISDPTKFDSFLNDTAKDVSAFLNSDGGLLILGVAEMRRKVGTSSGEIAVVRILPSIQSLQNKVLLGFKSPWINYWVIENEIDNLGRCS